MEHLMAVRLDYKLSTMHNDKPPMLPAFLHNMQKQTLLAPASSTCKDIDGMADVAKGALTNIALFASNSEVKEPEGVINWIVVIPTQRFVKQL